jgi:predicted PurR-regulated permease PerM
MSFEILSVTAFAERLPEAVKAIDNTTDLILDKVFGGDHPGLREHIERAVSDVKNGIEFQIRGFLDNASAIFKNVAAVIVDVITGIIFAYYFIKDKERIGDKILGMVPFSLRNDMVKLAREINVIISSFIRGQFTVALIVGVIETAGMWAIGLPVPWLFGIIGGLSNLIPYIGPVIGAVPAVFGALLVSPWRAILTVALFAAVQQLDNNFISPKIIEGKLGVHPVVSIIVLFIAGELWGIAGILIGIPLYAIIRCLFKYLVERRVRKAKIKRIREQ